MEVEELDDILFDAWLEEPDGGITLNEAQEQTKLLEAIKAQILEEGEHNAVKDKAAKEKWKIEQLEQKSAGCKYVLTVIHTCHDLLSKLTFCSEEKDDTWLDFDEKKNQICLIQQSLLDLL